MMHYKKNTIQELDLILDLSSDSYKADKSILTQDELESLRLARKALFQFIKKRNRIKNLTYDEALEILEKLTFNNKISPGLKTVIHYSIRGIKAYQTCYKGD